MPDYSLGKIYALKSPSCDAVYIGSTCKKYLSQRLTKHNDGYKQWFNNDRRWMSSFLILGFGDAYIELIEEYPCNSKDQLNQRERIIIESYPNAVNQITPYRTKEEINLQCAKNQRVFRLRRKLAKIMSDAPVEQDGHC